MAALTLLHSIPATPQPRACESTVRLPHPRLRPFVLAYGGSRSGAGTSVRHRILPFNVTTLIIDCTTGLGLVTGARSTPNLAGQSGWGTAVTVGLTPVGVRALLGVPMPELAEGITRLPDLLGRRAAELSELLGGAPDWPSRFALLDERLAAWSTASPVPDGRVVAAWWRLQRDAGLRIGTVAGDLGVSRRYLELGFRRWIGLSPATVARIGRFQRALHQLGQGSGLSSTAADNGYADQPHFNREIRRMSGLTPTDLYAFLQYREQPAQ